MIYEAREDSELLRSCMANHAKGKILDMGTGSGVLAEEALNHSKDIIAVDINQDVVDFCKKQYPGIQFRWSNLFSNITEKFDCIIFNPPYLPDDPQEDKESALVTSGGKFGWETIERFLFSAPNHLKYDGVILLLFSTFTNKQKVEDLIQENGFRYEVVGEKKIPWETLYVYALRKKASNDEEF